jgi:rhamnosyltransferase
MEIGVVIRTLDEAELIGRCLETLHGQQGSYDLDVVVVDSGSTDATVEIAQAHGARVVHMEPADFDYSKALNLGIEEARGELVAILSAHAIPLDDRWLERMTAPFDDPKVAGVASRQIAWPGAPWSEVQRLRAAFGDRRRDYAAGATDGLLFSNAASAIRRSVWRDRPFTLPAAEDLDWARRVVAAGLTVVYEPAATVYHSHDEPPRAQARRMIDINRVVTDGGERTRLRTVREAAALLYHDGRVILGLDEPLRRRLSYLGELLQMIWYYVIDFSQAGSTAERRRDDARPASG